MVVCYYISFCYMCILYIGYNFFFLSKSFFFKSFWRLTTFESKMYLNHLIKIISFQGICWHISFDMEH